jgi:hypothetical protein
MSISLNPQAVIFARRLIMDGKIKNDEGHWGDHNPDAAQENAFIQKHEMDDFKTVHRDGLIAAKERAAQQGYRDIENAADELLQELERQSQR